jgi:glycosyltransferase involved in cell wall biosynthesis
LNQGLDAARGELIGFLDADDLWEPERLARQLALLADNPGTDLIWGRTRIVFLDGRSAEGSASPDWPPRHYPSMGAILFRKHVFDTIGRFDVRRRHAQDIDFLARVSEAGLTVLRQPEVVQVWRRHGRNMTNQVELDRRHAVEAVREALVRRRTAATGQSDQSGSQSP